MAAPTASLVRAAAFLMRCLSSAKSCSMGFRSGEHFWQEEELCADRANELTQGLSEILCLRRVDHHEFTKRSLNMMAN
jgi:hypothetical protein